MKASENKLEQNKLMQTKLTTLTTFNRMGHSTNVSEIVELIVHLHIQDIFTSISQSH